MKRLGLLCAMLALCFALDVASAQTGSEKVEVAAPEEVFHVPEDKRGRPLLLVPDSRGVVTLDEKMRIATIQGGGDPGAPEGPAASKEATTETLVSAKGVAFSAAPDTLVFTIWADDKDGTRLKLENGTGKRLIYIAALVMEEPPSDKMYLTTICSVEPGRAGFETWPERVHGIAILSVYEPPASNGMICVDPRKGKGKEEYYTLPEPGSPAIPTPP